MHPEALHRRDCDFWLVGGEMELHAPRFGLPRTRLTPSPTTATPSSATAEKRRIPKGKSKASATP